MTLMEHHQHPALFSPPIPPPPPPPLPPLGLDLTGLHHLHGVGHHPPPPMPYDSLYPPPHFIPPPPADLHLPAIPLPVDHHRPPPLGMIAPGRVDHYDVDFRREMSAEPHPPRNRGGYMNNGSPPRRYPSPLGSERSVRSDRSDRDRMDRYDDHFRWVDKRGDLFRLNLRCRPLGKRPDGKYLPHLQWKFKWRKGLV